MGMKSWDDVVARLKEIPGYRQGFAAAFGSADAINVDNAAKARLEFRPLKANARQIALSTLAPAALMIPAANFSPLTARLRLMA